MEKCIKYLKCKYSLLQYSASKTNLSSGFVSLIEFTKIYIYINIFAFH